MRGDVEWTAEGCEAAVFTAAARHRHELRSVDAGGAAKLAEAAARFDLTRFVLASVVGADRPERHEGVVREFIAAKRHAERRLGRLMLPWTILRFGRLTEDARNGRIDTVVSAGAPLTTSRDVAALAIADVLERRNPPQSPHTGAAVQLGVAQADTPPDDPEMIQPDAPPLDADLDWEGDGPVPPGPVSGRQHTVRWNYAMPARSGLSSRRWPSRAAPRGRCRAGRCFDRLRSGHQYTYPKAEEERRWRR